tara:strand:+ start:615 stop:953 length:339 start_codon:yes stop_codon:yes gene_type:complete
MSTQQIPLGQFNSKLYEKEGELYYKITPVFGLQANFHLDAPVSEIEVLKNCESELKLRRGILTLKMVFKPYVSGLSKLRICPLYFGFIPMGMYFCEVAESNKERLLSAFQNS